MSRMQSIAAVIAIASVLGLGGQAAVSAQSVLTDGDVLQTASFIGQSDHTVSGNVRLVQDGEVFYLVLGEDFQFDGAPDPRLGFSTNDEFDSSSIFSSLNLDSGQQVYRLPATLDVSQFDEVTIWCEKFGVPLAEAKF
ncbi:MAG: DM13 domain-containing protein [Synechococcus sp.]